MKSDRLSEPTGRHLLQCAALGLAYFAIAALTVRLTRFDGGLAFIWAAGPLMLGVLMITDRSRWLSMSVVCGAASFVATWLFGLGLTVAFPLAIINVGEAWFAAELMRRWCPRCDAFQSIGEIALFLLVGAGIVPAASACAGALVAAQFTLLSYGASWLTWYTAHALGTAIVTPLVLLTLRGDVRGWTRNASPQQRIEGISLLAILTIVTAAVFAQNVFPLLFMPFLPMMIAVFRFGRMGATASTVIITVIGAYFTMHGSGPIAVVPGGDGVHAQILQLYLATGVLMALPAAGDLKRRQQTLIEVQEQSALQRLILDRTGDVIMTLRPDGRIRYVSPSARSIIGRDPATLVGTMPHTLIHPDDVEAVVRVHRQALAAPDRTFIVEYRVVSDGREIGWFETHTRATVDDQDVSTGVVSIIRDVSRRKEAEAVLTIDALTDPLTGLANRRAFDRALARQIERKAEVSPRASVAIFDLDHFKDVNDRYGHAIGDKVIRAFADLLRAVVRDSDIVARIGGEEFVALLTGADLEQAAAVCDRVRLSLAKLETPVGDGRTVRVTVSGGIAAITADQTAEEIVAAADGALYQSKARGRNRLSLAA